MMRPARAAGARLALVALAAFVALPALMVLPAAAAHRSANSPQAMIPGIYELQEWHTDAGVLKPPQVYGRFMLVDGMAATILRNEAQADKRTTSVSVGRYVLDDTHFAYGYQNASAFTETPAGVTASHKIPWEGLRSFSIRAMPDEIRATSDGGQEFVFTKSGVTYCEQAGKPLRVYRRISPL
jgi:hypothetical protein